MSNGTPGDGDPQLVDALHRIYIESLPAEQRAKILEKATEAVKRLDLPDALDLLAARSRGLDRLQTWHLVASFVHRRPELAEDAVIGPRLVNAIANVAETAVPIDETEVVERLKEFGATRQPSLD